jgi:acetone carboxylase gamma subunit
MKCECGFKFAGPGEFRNCNAFITSNGDSGIICPTCGNMYVNQKGHWYKFVKEDQK